MKTGKESGSKANKQKWVFKHVFKMSSGWKVLKCRGSLKAATAKSRSPPCLNLDLGTVRSICSADLSDLMEVCRVNRSVKQGCAWPCKDLKTNNKILKSVLKCTGTQCKDANVGDTVYGLACVSQLEVQLQHFGPTTVLL